MIKVWPLILLNPYVLTVLLSIPSNKLITLQTFKSYAEYDTHVKQFHMGNWKFKCGICEDVFDTKDEIRSHRMKKHLAKTKLIKPSSR